MLPILRVAYNYGFDPVNGMVVQNLFAFIILALVSVVFVRTRLKLSQALGLMGVGVSAFIMSIAFFFALRYVSATVTIILLFQYIWMGIAIQAVLERRIPHPLTLLSGVIIIFGTVLTTGATIGSCAEAILAAVPDCKISIATLYASKRGLEIKE